MTAGHGSPALRPVLDVREISAQVRLRDSVVQAVDGLSLIVQPGQTLGLVGESGCGKTMTALSIMRLLPPGGVLQSGGIFLDGVELTGLSDAGMRDVRGRHIGMIFQDPLSSLNPTMPIGLQVAEPVRLHTALTRAQARARALEMLELVGLPDPPRQLNAFPHQLSGGMRQRVMIAMALACEPKLLIADEPTTGLDVTIQRQILDLIDELKARLGMAVILVTHDLGVIAGHADMVAVMYAGKIVEATDTTTLFGNPAHPYTRALFSALPERAAIDGHRLYSIPGMPPELTERQAGCRFAPRCSRASSRCLGEQPELSHYGTIHQLACFHPIGSSAGQVSYGSPDPPSGPLDALSDSPQAPPHPPQVRNGPTALPWQAHDRPAVAVSPQLPDPVTGAAAQVREILLSVDAVSKDFPLAARGRLGTAAAVVSAVQDVSFTLYQGETLGLVGESGCGKSTIGRLVVGLEHPGAGTIRFGGQELHLLRGQELRRVRSQLHLVFQDASAALDPRKRVQSSLEEPLVIHHQGSRRDRQERIRGLLDDVGLPVTAADRYPHEFSGGQRQRIALARSLALHPRLIVADEPVSALDVSVQAQILNLMVDLRQQFGLTYLLISHDLSVVRYLATTIAVMYMGNLVEIGPTADVYERPVHPYTRGLIDAIPLPNPAIERTKAAAGIAGELPSPSRPPSGCRFRTRCPRAQSVCAEERPPLVRFGHPDHLAACHFPLWTPSQAAGADISL